MDGLPMLRGRTLEELERQALGLGGVSIPPGLPFVRGRRGGHSEGEMMVDESRVHNPELFEPQRLVANPMEMQSGQSVSAVGAIDIQNGMVSSKWGLVMLTDSERTAIAKIVTAAIRRSWNDELDALEKPRVRVASLTTNELGQVVKPMVVQLTAQKGQVTAKRGRKPRVVSASSRTIPEPSDVGPDVIAVDRDVPPMEG